MNDLITIANGFLAGAGITFFLIAVAVGTYWTLEKMFPERAL